MDSERHQKVSELFQQLVELTGPERAEALANARAENPSLADEVRELLADADRLPTSSDPVAFNSAYLPSDQEASTLTQIGAYRILDELGHGGMGVVYRAEQQEPLRRTVALKLVKRGMDTAAIVARARAERQALASMNHANIARVFDAGAAEDGRPYFVMELVEGLRINHYCNAHQLGINARLHLFLQVCDGVQYAHQRGFIHRDLKPSNVLIDVTTGKPEAKIIDFGIAKALLPSEAEETMHTQQGQSLGTPEYMSPEQALGNSDIDTRTDVYSLGVLLYELLTGSQPFMRDGEERPSGTEILRRVREDDPARPSVRAKSIESRSVKLGADHGANAATLSRSLQGDLDWIVMTAIEKDRQRRYASPDAFADDIRRHLLSETIVARPSSAAYRARKFLVRHRIGVGFAVLTFGAMAAIAVTFALQSIRVTRERDRANEEATRAMEQARTATAVVSLLTDLFKINDPSEARGNSVTAREILDRAETSLKVGLQDQPLIRAQLHETMGQVFLNLGLRQRAHETHAESLRLRESLLPKDHPDIAVSLVCLASCLGEEGKPAEALALLDRARAIYAAPQNSTDPDRAVVLLNSGVMLHKLNRFHEATLLLEEAIRIDEANPNVKTRRLALANLNLGHVLDALKDQPGSLAAYNKAVKLFETEGQDYPDLALAYESLGAEAAELKRLDEAERLFLLAYELRLRTLPADHPDIAYSLANLANIAQERGDFVLAETRYRDAIKRAEHPGSEFLDLAAAASNNLACLLLVTGRPREADQQHQRALSILWHMQPPNLDAIGEAMEQFAGFLDQVGRHAEAEALMKKAEELRSLAPKSSGPP